MLKCACSHAGLFLSHAAPLTYLSVDTIAIDLPSATADLQSAMCYLLSALAAFSDATHASIASTGLVPQLVAFSRPRCLIGDNVSPDLKSGISLLI